MKIEFVNASKIAAKRVQVEFMLVDPSQFVYIFSTEKSIGYLEPIVL